MFSQYSPVRVVVYAKPMTTLMTQTLTKKLQPLLVISPLGVGLANDYGPEPTSTKHKKNFMLIAYEQIIDLHAMLVHPPLPNGKTSMLQGRDETLAKK